MKDIVTLLKQLELQGVRLALNPQGQLISQSSKEAVTAEIAQQIKQHKEDILRCLRARQAFEQPIPPQGKRRGPLSSSQSGLWFIEQYEERSHLYNMPVYFRLTGQLDVAALEFALQILAQKHASLRTRFIVNQQGKGEQWIDDRARLRLEHLDLSALPPAQREREVQRTVREEINRPFDLTAGDLTRVRLVRLGERLHVLLITQHHIISDGWSVKNLFADLKPAFLAYQSRQPCSVAPTRLNYIDYAEWFNSAAFLDYHDEFKAFWVERLAGIPEVHALPLDKPRPAHQNSDGEVIFSAIDNRLWARFKALCQRYNASNFIGLHAVFSLLLARVSGERDIVIGSPLAYRERHDIEDVVGFFVNTIVLRTQLRAEQSFADYLRYCREQDLSAFDHQLYRFEALSEAIGSDRTTAINPIFQIMLVYQAKVDFDDLIPGCGAVEETSPLLPAKTDISVKVTELMGEVRLDWLFATALFERATIQHYADRFIRLIEAVVAAPETDIWRLPLMENEMLAATIEDGKALSQRYPSSHTCDVLIEGVARQRPDGLAIAGSGAEGRIALSYAELSRRSNQLAHWLRQKGIGADTLVGVLAKRDGHFVVALLAIWKAGAAYVPLDPDYPPDRLSHIITDAKLALILGGDSRPMALWPATRQIDISSPAFALQLQGFPGDEPPELVADPQRLAQVIYTSGSTGLPKGVMIEQGSLVNLLDDHRQRIGFSADSTMFNCMSLSFDAGNMATLLPLFSGGTLAFGDPHERTILDAEQAGASHLILPTALMSILDPEQVRNIRAIGLGGEACPTAVVENWGDRVELHNMYGPTECTVTALSARLRRGGPITVGRPIANLQALILDEVGQLCPVGVPGELCLSGLGLARGYLNQPELTASRFMIWPLTQQVRLRIYRTGDRARLLHSGDYAYCGRIDEQIKLRGYRIEPGEIESQLALASPALQQVKVVVASVGERRMLVAYATLRPQAERPDPASVLQAVSQRLPEYMVPFRLLLLEHMPLTPNGKLDVRRLPDVEAAAIRSDEPDTPMEADVLAIWRSVLNTPLGVEDDFFRLGGDSILSIQLTTRLRDAGYPCTVKEVFEAKNVRRLCRILAQQAPQVVINAEQGLLQGEFALLPIQRWFFEQRLAQPQHWNQAVVLQIPAVAPERLREMLQALIHHHDALRLSFSPHHQRYLGPRDLPALHQLDYRQLGEEGLQHALSRLQGGLDPANGKTLICALIRHHPQADEALFLACHHLAVDAVSWRQIAEDLARLHRGEPLPAKTSSYRQWGQALERYAQRHAAQFGYWQQQGGDIGYQALRQAADPQGTASYTLMQLSREETRQLTSEANAAFSTEISDLLLAALTRTLARMGWGARQTIMLEGHGREAIDEHLDVSRTVGWFTSTFPLCLSDCGEWPALIKHCKEQLRAIPDKGVGFNPLRYHHPQGERLQASPVVFNYLGFSAQQHGEWRPLGIRPGDSVARENKPAEIVSIHGGVFDGQLQLRQVGCLTQALSDGLMTDLADNLRALLTACQRQLQQGPAFTPSDFPALSLSQRQLDRLTQQYQIDTLLPLSSLQESMLYHRQRCPQDDAYHLQTPIRYAQSLDVDCYRRAWRQQLRAFPALRVALEHRIAPLQVVTRRAELPFILVDLSGEPEPLTAIERCRQQDLRDGFDLSSAPLLRIYCFKLSEQEYRVLLSCHHSIIDGWSGPQLLGAVHRDYDQRIRGLRPDQRIDNAYRENALHAVQQRPREQAFWRQKAALLAQANDLSALLGGDLGDAQTQASPAVVSVSLSAAEQARLVAFAREIGVTPSIIAQYAWHRMLAQTSGDRVTAVGNVISGRESPIDGIGQSVGLYINSLPLMLEWHRPQSLGQHLLQLQRELMLLNQHGGQSLIALTRGGPRLFNSLFIYENYPGASGPAAHGDDRQLRPEFATAYEKVEFPFNLVVRERQGSMLLRFEFDAAALDVQRVERVLARWLREIVDLVGGDAGQPAFISAERPSASALASVPSVVADAGVSADEQGERLIACWAETLGLQQPVWLQSLRELAVDSLQQLRLANALSQSLARPIPLALLQQYPSPQRLHGYLLHQKNSADMELRS